MIRSCFSLTFEEDIVMSPLAAVTAILAALMLGAVSPGPSFIVVARNSIGLSRRAGVATAVGMGAGGVVFSAIALVGLYALLTAVAWLYIGLKIAGGIYLVYLASKIWRGAKTPLSLDGMQSGHAGTGRRAFWTGLGTQMSNPKTAIVYGSIFAALLPRNPPLWCYIALPPLVFAVEAGWYTVVALSFSSERPRALYVRWKTWVDRLAAGAIAALGLRLIFNAHKAGV